MALRYVKNQDYKPQQPCKLYMLLFGWKFVLNFKLKINTKCFRQKYVEFCPTFQVTNYPKSFRPKYVEFCKIDPRCRTYKFMCVKAFCLASINSFVTQYTTQSGSIDAKLWFLKKPATDQGTLKKSRFIWTATYIN
jgi:hypothetical protein